MLGLNIAWDNFGSDIGGGGYNATFFEEYFSKAEDNKQNIARFWVHCDGQRGGLIYNTDGSIKGLSTSFNQDLTGLLAIAANHSVVVQLCLWSFDMCKDEVKIMIKIVCNS